MIGVQIQDVTAQIAKAKNLGLPSPRGALVADVTPGGGADQDGIKVGDVILAYDGHPVDTASDLPPLVGATTPGSEATLQISRDGKQMDVKVKVGELPRDQGGATASAGTPERAGGALGLAVQAITPAMRQQLGLKDNSGGVVISDVAGAAAQAGLQPGDVVLRVGNQAVNSVAQFKSATARVKPGDTVLLLVSRDGASRFVAITVPKK
jgi:serine protease Do